MKNILLIVALVTSSLASFADSTYTLNAKCQAKVAKISKSMTAINLEKGIKITSVKVRGEVKPGDFSMTTVTTDIGINIQGENEGVTTYTSVVDTKEDCIIKSISID